MSAPAVYAKIAAITAELATTGIAKSGINADDQYSFRSIDDVMAALSPLLAKHQLCVLPSVLERIGTSSGQRGGMLQHVTLKVAYTMVAAEDGSAHSIESYGEALDASDKATSKAMSAAYKYAMLQVFCVPVAGIADPDRSTSRMTTPDEEEPVQGWEQWSLDIRDVARACETDEALDRLQNSNRALLRTISRAMPILYTAIGDEILGRRKALAPPKRRAVRRKQADDHGGQRPASSPAKEPVHATA